MYSPSDVKYVIKNYKSMLSIIKKKREELMGSDMVGAVQSGTAPALPMLQDNTDPIVGDGMRQSEEDLRTKEMERKILFVQKRVPYIDGDREGTVLNCLLDGMILSAVSRHMLMSRRTVHRMLDSICHQIASI